MPQLEGPHGVIRDIGVGAMPERNTIEPQPQAMPGGHPLHVHPKPRPRTSPGAATADSTSSPTVSGSVRPAR